MRRKLRENWPYLLLIPFVAAAVAGWFLLPDMVVVQRGVDGQPSRLMPKLLAVLVPVALAALGSSQVCLTGKRRTTGAVVLVVAVLVTVLLFVWNL